jgi:ferritin
MLGQEIQNALNNQVAHEAYASNYYLSMASWCEKNGLLGSASFLYKHSEQEKMHMMKLFRYINEAGGHALAPSVKEPQHDFKSIIEIFELVLQNEISVTKLINELVDLCLNQKDYSTFNFLQWYVSEQHEEERLFKLILDKIKIIGADGRGIFWIDKEIGKLADEKK